MVRRKIVFVFGLVALISCSLANKTSVLFVAGCVGANGLSPSGEPITSCAGTPHKELTIDGRTENADGVHALASGSRVVFTVTAGSDDVVSVDCRVILPGHRRTLIERKGGQSVTCATTIP